ncbi:MAG: hypothetical protein ACOX5Z_10160 [Desulfobulbus sp.]|jgi:multisubunit Na+/H+ antiporter MnhB subunit
MTILDEVEQWEIEDRRWWRVVALVVVLVLLLSCVAVVYALYNMNTPIGVHSGKQHVQAAIRENPATKHLSR